MRTLLTGIVSLCMLASVGIAGASTVVLSPSTVSVTKGQTFSVLVNIDPAGVKLYTVKGVVTYPADMLEATSFTFAAGTPMWIPLSQSGYDSMTAGNVTKTAGFPGGFITTKSLGPISFRAKESGTATITASPKSLAFDAQSKNTISGAQGSSLVTIAAPVVPAPAPQPVAQTQTAQTRTVAQTPSQASQTVATGTGDTVVASEPSTDSQVAAAGLAQIPWWVWTLLGVILAGGLFYGWRQKFRN